MQSKLLSPVPVQGVRPRPGTGGLWGLLPEGGSEEAGPLRGGKGEVSGLRVLGVADGRAAGELGHLDAVLVLTAVAALTKAGWDVGYLDTVLRVSAVAAFLERKEGGHEGLSRDFVMLVMRSADLAALRAEP